MLYKETGEDMSKLSGQLKIGITNIQEISNQLNSLTEGGERALQRTTSDFKRSATGWVAKEVSSVYNIKTTEVKPTKGGKPVGGIWVDGETISSASITYKGRVLTPIHFGMAPRIPKPAYALKATIFRGQRKTLGQVKRLTKKQRKNVGRNFTRQGTRSSNKSPIMLMHAGGGTYIPMQRVSKNRKDIEAIRTLSLPQMVENERVRQGIDKAIDEKLSKRFYHHLERCVKAK